MSTSLSQYPSLGEGQLPPRPAPKRTYGRKRASTPSDEVVPSLLTTTLRGESPSKGLLNRFANNSTTWKDSLAGLGSDATETSGASDAVEPESDSVEPRARLTNFAQIAKGKGRASESEEDSDDQLDPAVVKRELERMRQQARGKADPAMSTSASAGPERVTQVSKNRNLSTTIGSSSLSELPSDLSSPPRVRPRSSDFSSAVEEETIPVRKSGIGRRRVVLDSEDDDEELFGDTTIHGIPDSPTPTLQADATPTLRNNLPSSPPGSPSPRRPKVSDLTTRALLDDEAGDDDDKESIDDFFAGLAEESAAAEVDGAKVTQEIKSSAEGVGLFDDEDNVKAKPKKTKKPKVCVHCNRFHAS